MTSKFSPAVDDTGVFASFFLALFYCRFSHGAAIVITSSSRSVLRFLRFCLPPVK